MSSVGLVGSRGHSLEVRMLWKFSRITSACSRRPQAAAADAQDVSLTCGYNVVNAKRVQDAVEAAVMKEAGVSPATARDVAFHMTDWLEDLRSYYEFCEAPDSHSTEAVEKMLISFLVHVPNHVAAASKLLLDIPVTDVFGIGATIESDGEEG